LKKHLLTVHAKEQDVRRLSSMLLGQSNAKAISKVITMIRNEGNHRHNISTKKNMCGTLHVARVPKDLDCDAENFKPCHLCLLWLSESRLYRHKCIMEEKGRPSVQKSRNILYSQVKEFSAGTAKVLAELLNDKVGNTVRCDALLLKFLERKVASNKWHMKKWRDQMRIRLRYGGRLLLQLQQMTSGKNFYELLTASNFDAVVQAAKLCSIREDGSRVPDVSLKIGHLLNHLIKIKWSDALKSGDSEGEDDMRRLSRLMKNDWCVVSEESLYLITERHRHAKIMLPTTDDMKKFANGLAKILKRSLERFTDCQTSENYRLLKEAALVRIIQFNRKR